MSEASEIAQRVISELEELRVENVIAILNTILTPMGKESEVEQLQSALRELMQAGLIEMGMERFHRHDEAVLQKGEGLALIDGLAAVFGCDFEEKLWTLRDGDMHKDRYPIILADGGRWTSGGGGVQEANLRNPFRRLGSGPKSPTVQPKRLEELLKPRGREIGVRTRGAGDEVRTVPSADFKTLETQLLQGAQQVPAPPNSTGTWYRRFDGTVIGVRESADRGRTLEIIQGMSSGLPNGFKVHKK